MAQSALIAAFMAGLLGGLHCVAMCGGFVGALAAGPARGQILPILHARDLLVRHVLANFGRVASYVALGAVAGAAGAMALGTDWVPLLRVLYAVANLLLLALAYAIATGRSPFAALERAGLAVYRRLVPAAARLGRSEGPWARLGLGILWGLTPCGLVYGVVPVAMLSGSAADGALVMALFGLGTLPNLIAAGVVAGGVQQRFRAPGWRYAAAAVVSVFALVGLYRAWFVPAALAQGPFCIVP